MPRTSKSNRAQSTQNPDNHTNGQAAELLPPAGDSAPAQGMKKVTVQRTERFIEPSPPVGNSANRAPESSDDGHLVDCPHCEGKFRAEAFDDNDGYCPGCGRDEFGDVAARIDVDDDEPEPSEAEILLQSIANDDEYSLRVDRLVNFEVDNRADSRAAKEFCTILKPVTLDYLDVVRRMFGGGAYYFMMFKRGRAGVVKCWHESIAKPNEVGSPDVPAQIPSRAEQPGGLAEVEKSLDVVERVWKMMNRSRPNGSVETTAGPPLPPANPITELQNQISMLDQMSGLVEKLRGPQGNARDSVGVTALNIVGGILKDPSVTPLLAAGAQWLVAKAQGVGGPPKEVLELIDVLVDQMTKNNHPIHSANHTLAFLKQHPQFQAIVSQFANQSATEALIAISQLKPEYAHIRKLQHGPAWLDAFKKLLIAGPQQTPPAPPMGAPPVPPESVPGTAPAAAPPKSPDEKAFARVLRGIAADMSRSYCSDAAQAINDPDNADAFEFIEPENAVTEVLSFLKLFPAYRAQLSMIQLAPPEIIVGQIAEAIDDEALAQHPGAILYAHHFKNALVAALAAENKTDEAESNSESQTTA